MEGAYSSSDDEGDMIGILDQVLNLTQTLTLTLTLTSHLDLDAYINLEPLKYQVLSKPKLGSHYKQPQLDPIMLEILEPKDPEHPKHPTPGTTWMPPPLQEKVTKLTAKAQVPRYLTVTLTLAVPLTMTPIPRLFGTSTMSTGMVSLTVRKWWDSRGRPILNVEC